MSSPIKYNIGVPTTNLIVIDTTVIGSDDPIPHFKIIYGSDDNTTSVLEFNWDELQRGLKTIIYYQKNESLLIEAVRNFIRKINFSELNEKLDNGEISEDVYYKELEQSNDKYALTLKNINSPNDVLPIIDLVRKIGYDLKDLSTSDVSEMFSVKENQLVDYINKISAQIK